MYYEDNDFEIGLIILCIAIIVISILFICAINEKNQTDLLPQVPAEQKNIETEQKNIEEIQKEVIENRREIEKIKKKLEISKDKKDLC